MAEVDHAWVDLVEDGGGGAGGSQVDLAEDSDGGGR